MKIRTLQYYGLKKTTGKPKSYNSLYFIYSSPPEADQHDNILFLTNYSTSPVLPAWGYGGCYFSTKYSYGSQSPIRCFAISPFQIIPDGSKYPFWSK